MIIDKKLYPYFFVAFFTIMVIVSGAFFYFKKENPQITDNEIKVEADNEEIIIPDIAKSAKKINLAISEDDYLLGNKDSNIEIIIYDDPSEPFASRYYEVIKLIEGEFGDKVKIALRLLPLEVNDNSFFYDIAVLCAGEQGKYFEAYESVSKANNEDRLTTDSIFSILEELGLDMDKLEDCQKNESVIDKISKWQKEAEDNAIIGVPSTFINNQPFPGAYQFEDFVDSAGYQREGLRTVIAELLTDK